MRLRKGSGSVWPQNAICLDLYQENTFSLSLIETIGMDVCLANLGSAIRLFKQG